LDELLTVINFVAAVYELLNESTTMSGVSVYGESMWREQAQGDLDIEHVGERAGAIDMGSGNSRTITRLTRSRLPV